MNITKTLPRRKFFGMAAVVSVLSGVGLWFKPRTPQLKYSFLFKTLGSTEFYVGQQNPALPPKGSCRHFLNANTGNVFEYHAGHWNQLVPKIKPEPSHSLRGESTVRPSPQVDPDVAMKTWMSDPAIAKESHFLVQVLCPMATSTGIPFYAHLTQEEIDHPAVSAFLHQFFHGACRLPKEHERTSGRCKVVQAIPRNHIESAKLLNDKYTDYSTYPVLQLDLDADALYKREFAVKPAV